MLSRQQNSLCQVWETRGAGHPGWASNSIQPERRGRRGGAGRRLGGAWKGVALWPPRGMFRGNRGVGETPASCLKCSPNVAESKHLC